MNIEVRIVDKSTAIHHEEITTLTESHRSLSKIIQWLASQGQKNTLSDTVTQDEYTHDIIVKLRDEIHLVYDVT